MMDMDYNYEIDTPRKDRNKDSKEELSKIIIWYHINFNQSMKFINWLYDVVLSSIRNSSISILTHMKNTW